MSFAGIELVGVGFDAPRSMEQALADLRQKFKQRPTAAVSRMINSLEAEIESRKRASDASADPG